MHRLAVTGLLTVILVAAAVSPVAANAATRCAASKGSLTAIANAQVRVFSSHRGRGYYACSKKTGKVTQLGPRSSAAGLTVVTFSRWRLRGSLLAYARRRGYYKEPATYLVVVRDVRTGRTLRSVDAAPSDGNDVSGNDDSDPDVGVRDVALSSDGRVAWIVTNPNALGAPTQTWKADRAGVGLLDPGPDVAPASLQLTGDAVRWIRGGQPQSATLD